MFQRVVYRWRLWSYWVAANTALGVTPDPKEFERIFEAYGSAGRFHHSYDHIVFGVNFVGSHAFYGVSWYDAALLQLGFFYHDVVYDPAAPHGSNEQASANMFRSYLANSRVSNRDIDRVSGFILNTQDHQNAIGGGMWDLFNDADLMILASTDKTYRKYADNVWQEYKSFVSRPDFVRGRVKILEQFLTKPVFRNKYFMDTRELVANKNMKAELQRLREEEKSFA